MRFGKPKPTLLAVLPRGEAIRNFVYSGTLDEVSRNADVVLASVAASPDLFAGLAHRYAGAHQLGTVVERFPVRVARSWLNMAHGRHIWSEAAQERSRRRDQESVARGRRARRASWKAATRVMASPRGVDALSRLERTASRWFPPPGGAEQLIAVEAPDHVFNGSHIHAANAVPLVQAARRAGIPTSTFLFSWDNLTSQGRILDIYDHYLAWNDQIAADLLAMYPRIRPDQVRVTGTPQFDFHFHEANRWTRAHWAEEMGVDPDRPVVLYTTGMANHMPGEPEIVELLADQLASMPEVGPAQLLVRVYAKDRTGRFDELRVRRPDIAFSPVPWLVNWLTPLPEDIPLWTSTLLHVACGVNVASTVSLELAMFDKPTINIAFNPPSVPASQLDYARYYRFDHYRPVTASGAVEVVASPGELKRAVVAALRSPADASAARARLLQTMFGETLDGRSHERVAAALCEFIGVGELST